LSFAFISHRSFPGVAQSKLLVAVALILAGCGGAGNANWQQVRGSGFVFNAPEGWSVTGTAAASGRVQLVEVRVFRLVREYDPSRRLATARELDGATTRLAAQLKGAVAARRWLTVGGLDARSYTIGYAGKSTQITFVLDGRREYELLCRRPAGADDGPCVELLESFAVRNA
jgi:hypothetical protein